MHVLVTGGSGFIGSYVSNAFTHRGFCVTAHSRRPLNLASGISTISTPSLADISAATGSFAGIDCVLHLAGRAHVLSRESYSALEIYRNINVKYTLDLARQSVLHGVRRFVFVSSIKVFGDISSSSCPFTENDPTYPLDPYAISKVEAENELRALALQSGLELVIVRPPLVYGPGVKGNLRLLINLLNKKVPLPFASIDYNKRSLISLQNLTDILSLCVTHPSAPGHTFLASDQDDVSTACLLTQLGFALNSPANLFPVNPRYLKLLASLFRQYDSYQKLCCSLCVDSSLVSSVMGWSPRYSLQDGLIDSYGRA